MIDAEWAADEYALNDPRCHRKAGRNSLTGDGRIGSGSSSWMKKDLRPRST